MCWVVQQAWLAEYEEAHPQDLLFDICTTCGCGDDGGSDWISCDECSAWVNPLQSVHSHTHRTGRVFATACAPGRFSDWRVTPHPDLSRFGDCPFAALLSISSTNCVKPPLAGRSTGCVNCQASPIAPGVWHEVFCLAFSRGIGSDKIRESRLSDADALQLRREKQDRRTGELHGLCSRGR